MNRIRACLYLSVFVIMGLSDAIVPILPDISDEALTQGMLFSAYFAGALVSMIPLGMLADRYGNPPFIFLSIVLTVTSGLLIFFFDSPQVLVSARFIEGCACGAFFPAAFSMLTQFKNRRQYIGEFNFLLNIGLATGVAAAAALKYYHLKGGILLFALLALPALMLSLTPPASTLGTESFSQALTLTHNPKVKHKPQMTPNIFTIISDARYLQIWIITFVLFGATGVLVAYFPSFTDLTPSLQGIALSGVYLGAMATSLIGGHARTTKRNLIRTGALVTGIGIVITIYHPIGLTIMGAGSGFAMIGLVTGVAALSSDHGMAMGVFNTFTYGGFTVLPVFAAWVLFHLGYAMLFAVTGIFVCALVFFPLRALGLRDVSHNR